MRNFERYPRPSQIENSPTNFVCRLYNNEAPSGVDQNGPSPFCMALFICKINILIRFRPGWTINPINWMKKSFPFGNEPKFWKHIRDDIVTKLNWSSPNKFQIDPPPPTVLVIVGNGLWSNPFISSCSKTKQKFS